MSETRVRTSIPVDFETGGLRGSGRIKNVSEHGLFVSTRSLPDEGETVSLQFCPPGAGRIRVTGVVWWTTRSAVDRASRPAGFGLRLLEDVGSYGHAIDRLLGPAG